MRPVPAAAYALAKPFEQCRLVCFDSDGSGTPTIGWGRTHGLTKADVGVLTCTQAEADQWLAEDMAGNAAKAEVWIGEDAVAVMTDNQWGAICDFAYNDGPEFGHDLTAVLKAKRFDAVPAELNRYVYAHVGGKTVKELGLVRRRNAEVELWSTGEPGTIDAPISSGASRQLATPPGPTASTATPLHTQPSFIATCATAVCTTGAAAGPVVDQVSKALAGVNNQLAPYAANAKVASAQNTLLLVLALLACASAGLLWLKGWQARREQDGAPSGVAVAPKPALPAPAAPPAAVDQVASGAAKIGAFGSALESLGPAGIAAAGAAIPPKPPTL